MSDKADCVAYFKYSLFHATILFLSVLSCILGITGCSGKHSEWSETRPISRSSLNSLHLEYYSQGLVVESSRFSGILGASQEDRAALIADLPGGYSSMREESYTSFLHRSATGSKTSVPIDILLGEGAAVDVRDSIGKTPLHVACLFGQIDIVEKLLAAGADPNAASVDGVVPVMEAAIGNYDVSVKRDVIETLVRHGADVQVFIPDSVWENGVPRTPYECLKNFEETYGNGERTDLLEEWVEPPTSLP